ncbi:Por secretion system C-terminal sorting domain-containing protein [Mariniphaga anaerophila]|uniref:Por secretion system C-terminal sorting domain-containing protein n=1 Tax=Mariniphaga anaerophila TaxID=1484053 RepID=A0A1M5G0R4_9BACT|nr:T9SS type A sorting domain-containing protein [Mariniphaga anaerophila]SHF97313.1 Por secretion system C-terminal sorting domain-containing protein [Mariniphaga anaerophila]
MTTTTNITKSALLLLLTLAATFVTKAQTTVYSTNWNDSFDGWTVINDKEDSKTWDHRGSTDGLQVDNELNARSEEWIVSPEFDFSDGSAYSLTFDRAQADNPTPAGILDVYFAEDWTGDVSTATWQLIGEDITNGLPVGWDGGAGYREYTKQISSSSASVRIAFKYHSETGFDEVDNNKNRIRIRNFAVTTSASVDKWELPYVAAWASDLEDWTVEDRGTIGRVWKWNRSSTVSITDSKKENNGWLISPAISCASSSPKVISFNAGWNNAQSSNISLYYSVDYDGDFESATWVQVDENIIPEAHEFGLGVSSMYSYSKTIELEAAVAHFAIQYAPFGEAGDSQNEIRVNNFTVEEGTTTGIDQHKSATLNIYPNPVKDVLNITTVGHCKIDIYNLTGQLVKKTAGEPMQIDVSALTNGQYIITVTQGNEVTTSKFVKQ